MKIDIGPYPNPMTTRGIVCDYLELMYGEEWYEIKPHQYIWLDHIVVGVLEGFEKYILEPLNKVFCKRRIKVKYHNYDTWGLDHTLAIIIAPGLKQLKDTNHGYPSGLTEDEWASIMDEMIWAFNEIANDNPGAEAFHTGVHDIVWTKVDIHGNEDPNGADRRMDEGPNHTFRVDFEGRKAYDDRIQNGLELFGKYYQNLWD